MAKTLTIKLPDELEQQLEAQARRLNLSLEAMVLQSLTSLVHSTIPTDPIAPLLGTLTADVTDVSEKHDQYLGSI